jgi:putative tributyrin esterase
MFLRCDIHSNELGMATQVNVIMPQKMTNAIGIDSAKEEIKDIPVLYLLHGCSDDHTIWSRRTSIERYAAEYNLAIVMPFAARSFYTDMVYGQKWWSYISEELPQLIENYFPVSRRREDRFVAGLSMGGYGAFKLALRKPEKFAAAASLSGALDMAKWSSDSLQDKPGFAHEMQCIYGDLDKISGSDNDLFALSEKLVNSTQPKPALFEICGTEDFLYQDNLRFKAHLEAIGYDFKYFEEPGVHGWEFWDHNIQKVLEWLPIAENN